MAKRTKKSKLMKRRIRFLEDSIHALKLALAVERSKEKFSKTYEELSR